jgi:hypothetical protein
MNKKDFTTKDAKPHPLGNMLDFIAKYVPDAQDWGFAELGEILGRHILQEWQFRLKPGDFVVSFERDTWEDDIWVAYFQIVKRDKKEIEKHVENIRDGHLERTGQKKYMDGGFYHLARRMSKYGPRGFGSPDLLPMWECHVPLTDAHLKAVRDLDFPQRPEQFIAAVIAHGSKPEERRR